MIGQNAAAAQEFAARTDAAMMVDDIHDHRNHRTSAFCRPKGAETMIVSASRRTDVPAYYSAWLLNRLRAGFALVANPYNRKQVSRVSLAPRALSGLVLWSKNPAPLLPHLAELEGLGAPFYIQYTLNAYGRAWEPGLPPLAERIATFQALSARWGAERVIWRYDPILLSVGYDRAWHLRQFAALCRALAPATRRCIFSFVDPYPGRGKRLTPLTQAQMRDLAMGLAEIAARWALPLATCAEAIELGDLGIDHAACVDAALLARLGGKPLPERKDSYQRPACGCAASVDIGCYGSCPAGCAYCYARRPGRRSGPSAYGPAAPLLCGALQGDERITDKF